MRDEGIQAKRISMMETGGIDKGDIMVAGEFSEVKCGSHVPKWIYKVFKDGEKFVFARRDRREWKVVMDLEEFLRLIKK